MLIPRFSLRLLLVITTVCGFFFLVVAMATRGEHWAIGITVAVGSILLTFLLYATAFGIAWSAASVTGLFRRRRVAESPFAMSKPPPQYVEPVDPE